MNLTSSGHIAAFIKVMMWLSVFCADSLVCYPAVGTGGRNLRREISFIAAGGQTFAGSSAPPTVLRGQRIRLAQLHASVSGKVSFEKQPQV